VPRNNHGGGTAESPRTHNPPSPQSTTLSTIDRPEKVAVAVSNVPPPTPPAPATVWPEVPTAAVKASSAAVRDLKGLFGDAVVNKDLEPLTD